jgi:hypothetical protein
MMPDLLGGLDEWGRAGLLALAAGVALGAVLLLVVSMGWLGNEEERKR